MSDYTDLWNLLNTVQDFTEGGFRKNYGNPPEFFVPETCDVSIVAHAGWDELSTQILSCKLCSLAASRTNAVPGDGSQNARVMIIGEAPGEQEDMCGQTFVGKTGEYLDKWLAAIDLDRYRDCFVTNSLKCHPPHNRDPLPEEQEICRAYLDRQIELVKPSVILALGSHAVKELTGTSEDITLQRGRQLSYGDIPMFATFHPSAVLRNSAYRRDVWEDLQKLQQFLSNSRDV